MPDAAEYCITDKMCDARLLRIEQMPETKLFLYYKKV